MKHPFRAVAIFLLGLLAIGLVDATTEYYQIPNLQVNGLAQIANTSSVTENIVPAQPFNFYGGGTSGYTVDHRLTQTNAGTHSGVLNAAMGIYTAPVGSGILGPASSDNGLAVSAIKNNFTTTSSIGEVDGIAVSTRNAYGDTCGICVNSGIYAGGEGGDSLIFEGVSSIFGSGGITQQVDIQLGGIETGYTGTAGSGGFLATATIGTLTSGMLIQSSGGAGWTDAIQVNPNGTSGLGESYASMYVRPDGTLNTVGTITGGDYPQGATSYLGTINMVPASGTFTSAAVNTAYYIKRGSLTFVDIYYTITTVGSASGALIFSYPDSANTIYFVNGNGYTGGPHTAINALSFSASAVQFINYDGTSPCFTTGTGHVSFYYLSTTL